jgi:uncharacterized protein YybS (DUF2232 family)
MIVLQNDQSMIAKDIAKGTAIAVFIFVVSVYIPIIGFFCSLFMPLPLLFYRLKRGRKAGAIIFAATVIVMAALLDGLSVDMSFFIGLLFLGFILGEFFELNLSIEKTILYSCGSVLLSGLVILILYSNMANRNIVVLVSDYVKQNLELTMVLYQSMGMSEESIRVISNSLDHIQYVLVRIVPAMIVISTFFVAWTSLLLARPLLKSKSLAFPTFGSLQQWRSPEFLVWGVIGCGLLLLFPSRAVKVVALNGLLILMPVYFFQGIAIVSHFFNKKKFPRFLKLFLYGLIALQQLLLLVVIGVGFFDIWLNFRKLGIKNSSE